jgi:hypothetical protein
MIFCGNKENDIDKEIKMNSVLLDSLFSLTSDELFNNSTLSSASLFFIAETLTDREPRVDWVEFLQREMRNRGV